MNPSDSDRSLKHLFLSEKSHVVSFCSTFHTPFCENVRKQVSSPMILPKGRHICFWTRCFPTANHSLNSAKHVASKKQTPRWPLLSFHNEQKSQKTFASLASKPGVLVHDSVPLTVHCEWSTRVSHGALHGSTQNKARPDGCQRRKPTTEKLCPGELQVADTSDVYTPVSGGSSCRTLLSV